MKMSKVRDIVMTYGFAVGLSVFGLVMFWYISEICGIIMVIIALCIWFVNLLHYESRREKNVVR